MGDLIAIYIDQSGQSDGRQQRTKVMLLNVTMSLLGIIFSVTNTSEAAVEEEQSRNRNENVHEDMVVCTE